jgi:hypothetical protein
MTEILYGYLNARDLPEEEVADTFVVNSHYHKLLRNQSTLIVGPRGSGKTTLLKMLTSKALRAWQHEQAERVRQEVAFRAVYIPTDISWARQIRALEELGKGARGLARQLSRAAISANIFYSFLDAVGDALESEVGDQVPPASIHAFAEMAISAMQLPACIPSLDAVKVRLRERTSDIEALSNRLRSEGAIALPGYVDLDFIAVLSVLNEAFRQFFPFAPRKRWALCFDELEIAPPWFSEDLLGRIRGLDRAFVFKLCTSPTPHWPDRLVPAQNHDFVAIFLATGERDDETFMSELLCDLIRRRFPAARGMTPEDFYGVSPFADTNGPSGKRSYDRGSREWHLFRDLAAQDPCFSKMLQKKGIDPADPTAPPGHQRDTVLRKLKPIAVLRKEYVSGAEGCGQALRSRNVVPVYHGWDLIWRLSEGNPRWLKGIFDEMVAQMRDAPDLRRRPVVAYQVQAQVLRSAAERHAGYLRGLPELTFQDERGRRVALWPILERVAEFFHEQITKDDFSMDPVGSFVLETDPSVSERLIGALRNAEFQGGIVAHDYGEHGLVQTRMRGRTFRFTFLLAPMFGLLVRRLESLSLSACLAQIRSGGQMRLSTGMSDGTDASKRG